MNSRIKRFMDFKGISSSELADTIGVQRSNITHVLHGRNKPSFQFISKLLETYPEINAKWLIMGSGSMLEHGAIDQQDLFSEDENTKVQEKATPEKSKPLSTEEATTTITTPSSIQDFEKKIEKIVVFYTDQTFKEYGPAK